MTKQSNNIGHNSNPTPKVLTPVDLDVIKKALKEMDNSLNQADSERDMRKSIIDTVFDKTGVSKKVFRRMARVYHNADFDVAVEEDESFKVIYETVTGVK